jgi:hypothetical protein
MSKQIVTSRNIIKESMRLKPKMGHPAAFHKSQRKNLSSAYAKSIITSQIMSHHGLSAHSRSSNLSSASTFSISLLIATLSLALRGSVTSFFIVWVVCFISLSTLIAWIEHRKIRRQRQVELKRDMESATPFSERVYRVMESASIERHR